MMRAICKIKGRLPSLITNAFLVPTLIFSPVMVCAQSLNSFVESALLTDRTYRAARSESTARIANGGQLRSTQLPLAELSTRISTATGDSTMYGKTIQRDFDSKDVTLRVSQSLYNDVNASSWKQADVQDELASCMVEDAAQEVVSKVSKLYFEALLAADDLELLQSQHTMTAEQFAISSARYSAGQVSLADVLEPQTKRDILAAKILKATNELQVKVAALSSASGLRASLSHSTPIVPDNIADKLPPIEVWLHLMNDLQPDLCKFRLTMRMARLEIKKSQAEYKPTADAILTYGVSNNANGVSDSPDDRRMRSASIGIQITIPIFSGLSTQYKVKEMQAKSNVAQSNFEERRRELELQIESAYHSIKSSISQISSLKKSISTAKQAVDMNKLGYVQGLRVNLDLLNAQNQYFSALHELAVVRYSLLGNIVSLKRATGILKPSGFGNYFAIPLTK